MYQHDFINLFVNGNPVDGSRVSFKLNVNKILIPYKSHSGSTYYFDFTFSSDHTNPRIIELLCCATFNAPESWSTLQKRTVT